MNNNNGTIKTIATIIGLILAISSIVWGFATQNQKLEAMCKDVEATKSVAFQTALQSQKIEVISDTVKTNTITVIQNVKSIATIETKLDYLIKGQEEIKKQLSQK